jgi:hypothetical protein
MRWVEEQQAVSRRYDAVLTGAERRRMPAAFALMDAVLFVSLFYLGNWNRRAAVRHLRRAARLRPAAILGWDFWRVVLRLLWPRPLARAMRALWMRRRRQVPVPPPAA